MKGLLFNETIKMKNISFQLSNIDVIGQTNRYTYKQTNRNPDSTLMIVTIYQQIIY